MARIQVLALPTETLGDVSVTPFALIIDRVADDEMEYFAQSAESFRRLGAKAVLLYDCDLEVAGDPVLDDQARQAVEAVLADAAYPQRVITGPNGSAG